jgi:hypothetical protein
MTARNTGILAAVAIVVLALGLVFGTGNREQQREVPAGQPAFPGLAGKLQDAATLEVLHHGGKLLVARKGDLWGLPDKGGYPAQQAKVHELLAGLAELRLDEPRTADPDEYARLGVEDADGKDASSTLVRVLDAGGGQIAGLIVGHEHTGSNGAGDGVYVRRPGEARAWLAAGHLSADTDAQQWLDRDIASIPQAQVVGVTVTRGGQTLAFSRDGDKLALTAPADHPKLDQFKLDDIQRGLEGLTLTDVKPAPAPGTPAGEAVFTTSDGLAVKVTVSKLDTKGTAELWAELSATGDDKAKAAAEALQAKLKGWAYQLDSWKEPALVPALDDLKAYQPPPAAAAAPAPPVAPAPPASAEPAPAAK